MLSIEMHYLKEKVAELSMQINEINQQLKNLQLQDIVYEPCIVCNGQGLVRQTLNV